MTPEMKAIALRVAKDCVCPCGMQSKESLLEFAERFLAALPKPEPVGYQFQGREGEWHNFIDQRHFENTLADQSWPIRTIYVEQYIVARADLEATISEQAAEIERLKTVPMKYRRMRFNAALQDENAALKAELDGEKAAALNYRTDAIKAEKQRDELLAAIADHIGSIDPESENRAYDDLRSAYDIAKGGA